ncbi:uncharacterized protein LOC133298467 [Gastrolobium bilobum]|uniref:uncharacterized protein LOC133298467 n=1 Tax=Gastrolobium bilobum TaxID=150636 RepID=UPI002AAFF14B|nr:uncharacterized protein LOC133298467 [Gastrolobium bilobum]
MDSFSFNNLQAEKANAMLKYRKLRRIASLLRLVEVCVVLVLISRVSLQLPVAVRNSSEYFRDLSIFMNSPRFIFLIGNVIIITLFAQFSAQGSRTKAPEPNLYEEFLHNSTKNQGIQEYPEKQKTGTDDGIENRRINGDMVVKYPENHRICSNQKTVAGKTKVKDYRRCETEILRRVESEKPRGVLRRCETEKRRKSIESVPQEEVSKISYPEDNMSNEEFRLTVEAFIARQQRIRREEDYSFV